MRLLIGSHRQQRRTRRSGYKFIIWWNWRTRMAWSKRWHRWCWSTRIAWSNRRGWSKGC